MPILADLGAKHKNPPEKTRNTCPGANLTENLSNQPTPTGNPGGPPQPPCNLRATSVQPPWGLLRSGLGLPTDDLGFRAQNRASGHRIWLDKAFRTEKLVFTVKSTFFQILAELCPKARCAGLKTDCSFCSLSPVAKRFARALSASFAMPPLSKGGRTPAQCQACM